MAHVPAPPLWFHVALAGPLQGCIPGAAITLIAHAIDPFNGLPAEIREAGSDRLGSEIGHGYCSHGLRIRPAGSPLIGRAPRHRRHIARVNRSESPDTARRVDDISEAEQIRPPRPSQLADVAIVRGFGMRALASPGVRL